jgi:hypothetical protein
MQGDEVLSGFDETAKTIDVSSTLLRSQITIFLSRTFSLPNQAFTRN